MPTIQIDSVAKTDLAGIAKYIGLENHSPDVARRFVDDIHEKFETYARQPLMGEPRPELGDELRSFTFKKNYVVIYRPLDDGIDVLRIVHGARDYPKLFGGES